MKKQKKWPGKGQVLTSVEIDTSLAASHVTVLNNYPCIGLMGYCAEENPLSDPDADYQMVLQLISSAKKLVDYAILDCGSAMTNVFTPAAIESGELIMRILTLDPKGINYLRAGAGGCAALLFRKPLPPP